MRRRGRPGRKRRIMRRDRETKRVKQQKGERRCPKCKKVTFPNEASAYEAAHRVTTSTRAKVRMRAYKGRCGRWHLSHIRTAEELVQRYHRRHRRES